jgi:hypothetical protein
MDSLTAKNKRPDKRAALTLAVVKVGNSGRGFMIETEQGGSHRHYGGALLSADGRHLPPTASNSPMSISRMSRAGDRRRSS